jgi:hypothetical protein
MPQTIYSTAAVYDDDDSKLSKTSAHFTEREIFAKVTEFLEIAVMWTIY